MRKIIEKSIEFKNKKGVKVSLYGQFQETPYRLQPIIKETNYAYPIVNVWGNLYDLKNKQGDVYSSLMVFFDAENSIEGVANFKHFHPKKERIKVYGKGITLNRDGSVKENKGNREVVFLAYGEFKEETITDSRTNPVTGEK